MRREDVIDWKLQNDVKRRLSGIAGSFQKLSGSISSFADGGTELNKEALNDLYHDTAARICINCSDCKRCWEEGQSEQLRQLERLLDAIRECGGVDEGIRSGYLKECKHRFRFFTDMEQGICRMRQGMLWRSRINESREAVADQLTEMARIVDEFAGNLEQKGNRVWILPRNVYAKLWLRHIQARRMLMVEKSDGSVELHLTARCRGGHCVTTKEAAMMLGCFVEKRLVPCEESRNVIGREYSDYVFREDANFQVVTGVARATKVNSAISGDNFSFLYPEGNTFVMLLSDGMGSGEKACLESERVIELLEQFLEAGFKEDAAMRLINSMLILRPENTMISTMDVCVIHLATGVCDFRKAGAAATYILRGEWMESIHSTDLPAGMVSAISYDVKQKKLYDGDYIIMLSDGVLENAAGEEDFWMQAVGNLENHNPQEIANRILETAMQRENYQPQDDMTVLVTGLFQRKYATAW